MCTGEWLNARLKDVIESYPQMKEWELCVWDSETENGSLFYIGSVKDLFELYKDYFVFYTDEDEEVVQLEGDYETFKFVTPGE